MCCSPPRSHRIPPLALTPHTSHQPPHCQSSIIIIDRVEILQTLASITKHIRRSERPQHTEREISTNSYNKKQHLPPFGNISSSSSTQHLTPSPTRLTHTSALLEFTFLEPFSSNLCTPPQPPKPPATSNNNR